MKKYLTINQSFATIKQNTTVKTADQFIYKFLNKDSIYGELLESIANAEPKI